MASHHRQRSPLNMNDAADDVIKDMSKKGDSLMLFDLLADITWLVYECRFVWFGVS